MGTGAPDLRPLAIPRRAHPLYGDGQKVRDWLYLEDQVIATRAAGLYGDRAGPHRGDTQPAALHCHGGGDDQPLPREAGLLSRVSSRWSLRRLLAESQALVFNLNKYGYATSSSRWTSPMRRPKQRRGSRSGPQGRSERRAPSGFSFSSNQCRRGVRFPGCHGPLLGNHPLRPAQPLFGQQGGQRDHLVNAWNHNYGPWRFPEKPMLLYGDGRNVRGWLNVEDHAEDALLSAGAPHYRLITPVTDRPDRDRRYAVDPPASARSWAGGRAKALRRGCSGGRLGVLAGAGAN